MKILCLGLGLLLIGVSDGTNFIENYIVGTPRVICAENDVGMDVVTHRKFEGNIYVKGRSKDPLCSKSYAINGTNSYSLPLGKCGMQRLRTANPRGLSFSITVIVSFHPDSFITKNDRAFNIKCLYKEPDELVTSQFNVSQLPATELSDELRMPLCEYSVRTESPTGPVVTSATVGQSVYHVWTCTGTDMGMLVKRCFVTDDDGEDHAVIDPEGCTLDNYLIADVQYEENLMTAHAESQVFKYADSNQLYFTCQIRLCQKQMGMCEGVSPPKCPKDVSENSDADTVLEISSKPGAASAPPNPGNGPDVGNSSTLRFTRRARRHLRPSEASSDRRWKRGYEIDISSPAMLILDHDEQVMLHKAEMCVSKAFMPLIPLVLITVACISSSFTIIFFKNYCTTTKIVKF